MEGSVTFNTPPATSFSNNGPLTFAQPTVTLTAGGGVSYQFSAGATQQNPPPGNTTTVTENQQTAVSNLSASPNPVCAGQPVTFTASVANTTGTYDYMLTNEAGTTLTGTASGSAFSQTLTAEGSGVQAFTLTVTDATNGPGSASTNLTVNPLPPVTLTASPGPATPRPATPSPSPPAAAPPPWTGRSPAARARPAGCTSCACSAKMPRQVVPPNSPRY